MALQEQKQPVGALLDEASLLNLLGRIVPCGKEQAIPLPQLNEKLKVSQFLPFPCSYSFLLQLNWFWCLQQYLMPNQWDRHYYNRYGSITDFLLRHSQRFSHREDTDAVYRLDRGIHFGNGVSEKGLPSDAASTSEPHLALTIHLISLPPGRSMESL